MYQRLQTSNRKTEFGFRGSTVWNSLSSAVRDNSLLLNMFKRKLLSY